jgi:hypothetical protein
MQTQRMTAPAGRALASRCLPLKPVVLGTHDSPGLYNSRRKHHDTPFAPAGGVRPLHRTTLVVRAQQVQIQWTACTHAPCARGCSGAHGLSCRCEMLLRSC